MVASRRSQGLAELGSGGGLAAGSQSWGSGGGLAAGWRSWVAVAGRQSPLLLQNRSEKGLENSPGSGQLSGDVREKRRLLREWRLAFGLGSNIFGKHKPQVIERISKKEHGVKQEQGFLARKFPRSVVPCLGLLGELRLRRQTVRKPTNPPPRPHPPHNAIKAQLCCT